MAVTWSAPTKVSSIRAPTNFVSFLGTNLVLVALLLGIDLLMGRWQASHGRILTVIAVAASLLAFTVRLALTQYSQQREIVQRKTAQDELFAANETITGLLNHARIETIGITQISELGSLLQACSSRDEAFLVMPERLGRLFPGTYGAISVLNTSKDKVESAARWGTRLRVESEVCWYDEKSDAGLRSLLISAEERSALQEWLAAKLEEDLPEAVASQFRQTEPT